MGLAVELLKEISGDTSNFSFSDKRAGRWEALRDEVFSQAELRGVNPYFVGGVIWTESDFRPSIINSASGAQGLMQIMPLHNERFDWLGSRANFWKVPAHNINAGITILVDDAKLGRDPVRAVLARYGGFVENDPSDYVNKVLQRATFLMLRDFTK